MVDTNSMRRRKKKKKRNGWFYNREIILLFTRDILVPLKIAFIPNIAGNLHVFFSFNL